MNSTALWKECIASLIKKWDEATVRDLLEPLYTEIRKSDFCIYIPSQQIIETIKSRYLEDIKGFIRSKDKDIVSVCLFLVKHDRRQEEIIQQQLSLIDTALTFDTFITGTSNEFAYGLCKTVAENPKTHNGHVMIYSTYGLGKTHLLNATAMHIKKTLPQTTYLFVHAEKFVVEMVNAITNNRLEAFRAQYRSVDVLLIDDCHFFNEKERSQEELMNILLHLNSLKRTVIMTFGNDDEQLCNVDERLKTFFQWCITARIEAPSLETRKLLIQQKFNQAHCEQTINQQVIEYIAMNFVSNVREIDGAVKKLIAYSKFLKSTITIDFVKHTFRDFISLKQRNITIDKIQKIVADFYKISQQSLVSKSRSKSLIVPRQVAMYLARKMTKQSLPEIGKNFNDRDHATVLYACKIIEQILSKDKKIKSEITNLEHTILNG
ncbi:MAG: chromosomal replication initiator protein DnaA [Methylacidiphilales bacterium]|nr:chromosomal replication initiator protein DnaA [Candidatus Methylacidiphilales bacterium]